LEVPKLNNILAAVLLIAVLTVTVPLVLGFVLGTTGFIPSMITATNVALGGIVMIISKALKFW
jgi:hypothetical protein